MIKYFNNNLLPTGVELYDYIESSGTLYIDTDITVNNSTTLIGSSVDFQVVLVDNSNSAIIGGAVLTSGNDAYKNAQILVNNNNFYTSGSFTFNLNKVLNRTVATYNGNASGNPNASFLLFARNRVGLTPPELIFGSIKIFKATFYENNVLKRNMFPCTYLGEPGMWDTVEGKFYGNQGTGTFILGNKIDLRLYEYVYGSGLPKIDTGVLGHMNYTYEVKVQAPNTIPSDKVPIIWLAGSSITRLTMYVFSLFIKSSQSHYWSSWYTATDTPTYNTFSNYVSTSSCVLKIAKGYMYYNGTDLNKISNLYDASFVADTNVFLCPNEYIRVYYFKIWDDLDVLIRDFVPCSYNGTPGFWDNVEQKFYANIEQNASFVLGPEKFNLFKVNKRYISKLPSGYLELEYLASNNTENNKPYIDLGVGAYMNHVYEIDFLLTTSDVSNIFIWGTRGLSSYTGYNMGFSYSGNNFVLFWSNNLSSSSQIAIMSLTDLNKHTIKIEKGKAYLDGVLKGTSNQYNENFSITNANLYLFASNFFNSTPHSSSSKIYSYKDYDPNGNLVLNLVPAKRLSDNELGMYDLVTETFLTNSGTGSFTAGSEVLNIKEVKKIYIGSNLVAFFDKLPSGYTEVEYIKSTSSGGLYIDLGIKLYETLNTNYDIAMKFNIIGAGSDNNQPTLFGCQNASSPWPGTFIRMNSSSASYITGRYIGGTAKDNTLGNLNTDIELPVLTSPNKNVTSLNNSNQTHLFGTSLFCAFSDANNTPSKYIEAKLYYFKLFVEGNLVRDLIPCKNSNNVVGMYDLVNRVFYTSPNGAAFVAGSDV